jgi:hypothetical protein
MLLALAHPALYASPPPPPCHKHHPAWRAAPYLHITYPCGGSLGSLKVGQPSLMLRAHSGPGRGSVPAVRCVDPVAATAPAWPWAHRHAMRGAQVYNQKEDASITSCLLQHWFQGKLVQQEGFVGSRPIYDFAIKQGGWQLRLACLSRPSRLQPCAAASGPGLPCTHPDLLASVPNPTIGCAACHTSGRARSVQQAGGASLL